MAEIKCPMCGKQNPSELDVCQFCEARLKPLTDELSRSQPPIHPGDKPTSKDTGELEPILPQWLREVRQQARDSADDKREQSPAKEEAIQSEETADLLAGLQSQVDDDEEIPDWLTGLRGESVQRNEEVPEKDDDLAALKNMFGEEASPSEESEDSSLPNWISGLGESETESQEDDIGLSSFFADNTQEDSQSTEVQSPASDSDLDWAADFGAETTFKADTTTNELSIDSSIPKWLQDNGEQVTGGSDNDLPAWMSNDEPTQADSSTAIEETLQPSIDGEDTSDWLASLGDESTDITPQQESVEFLAESDTPDWLASLGAEEKESTLQPDAMQSAAAEGDTPDWLSSLSDKEIEAASQQEIIRPPVEKGDTPDWLASLSDESTDSTMQPDATQPVAEEGDMPDWLSSLGHDSTETAPLQDNVQPSTDDGTPDWLSSGSPKPADDIPMQDSSQPMAEDDMLDWLASSDEESMAEPKDETAPTEAFIDDNAIPTTEDETPDWLAGLGGETIEFDQFADSVDQEATPTDTTDEYTEKSEAPTAFDNQKVDPLSTDDVDALLSMDMPDWLSDVDVPAVGDSPSYSTDAQINELKPADLPDWVQSMRPVESVITETEGVEAETQHLEEKGPLAGLRGVLPALPGVGPSSKPKAYSIKLNASEDQQSSALMLEQLLAEEINPKPMVTQPIVLSQRVFRWAIAFLLLMIIGSTVFTGTQINPMPNGAPIETSFALRYIQETLPADAPVLLIFDYDAALAGELEAAAAPLIDHMLLLKHPRLTMVASTPLGAGLAERFFTNTQSSHNYQRGQQFTNLGYLPGGSAGVLAFANNPVSIKPLSTNNENAWNTPVLQGVQNLSDFGAIILLTSDAESTRIWIEQTESARGDTRLLVISSAQSGPMILPYVQSGQVDGMVTGLDGSAPIEQANSGRPGMVRRYWDAYGFGLLTAVVIIALGSLWSLITGLLVKRKEQGEE